MEKGKAKGGSDAILVQEQVLSTEVRRAELDGAKNEAINLDSTVLVDSEIRDLSNGMFTSDEHNNIMKKAEAEAEAASSLGNHHPLKDPPLVTKVNVASLVKNTSNSKLNDSEQASNLAHHYEDLLSKQRDISNSKKKKIVFLRRPQGVVDQQ